MQKSLFGDEPPNLPDWRKLREKGMAKADAHAADEWKAVAQKVLYAYAKTHPTLSGWQITVKLREMKIPTPTDRALGPLLVWAARQGWIEKTDRHENNPLAHGCPSPIWRSKLCEKTPKQS
jgi:hypothetical protein